MLIISMDRNKKYVQFELKPNKADKGRTLQGQAIVYNELSRLNEDSAGYWATKIEPFAFTESLKNEVFAYLEHDSKQLLARTGNDSLKINESVKGVMVQIRLPKTTLGNDVYAMVEEGLLKSMSFGVTIDEDEWVTERFDGKDVDVRIIKRGTVFETSVVANPAFEQTSVAAFSNDQDRSEYLEKQKNSEETEEVFSEEVVVETPEATPEPEVDLENHYALLRQMIRVKELTN